MIIQTYDYLLERVCFVIMSYWHLHLRTIYPLHVTSINSLHVVLEHFPYREYDTTETKRSMCNCVMETKQSDLSNKVRMMEPVWTKSNIVRHKPIFRVNIQEEGMKKE